MSEEDKKMADIRDRAARGQAFVLILALAASAFGSPSANAGSPAAGLSMAQAAPAPQMPGASRSASRTAPEPSPITLVETRITELHKQLGITPAEEPQFKAYADVMRSNAEAMHTLFQERAQSPDTSAISLLRWYAKLTAAHAEAVNKLVPVFAALYQTMSAQQKKVADAVFAPLRQRPERRRAG
jgi:periplasmic protein CpxP/Spy